MIFDPFFCQPLKILSKERGTKCSRNHGVDIGGENRNFLSGGSVYLFLAAVLINAILLFGILG